MTPLAWCVLALCAFDPPTDRSGPISVTLSAGEIGRTGEIRLLIENASADEATGLATFRATPPWRAAPRREAEVKVPPHDKVVVTRTLEAAGTVFPELYAVHAMGEFLVGGRTVSVAPVLVFSPKVAWPDAAPAAARSRLVSAVPETGGSLQALGLAEVRIETFGDGGVRTLPQGWSGTDDATGTLVEDGAAVQSAGRSGTALSFHVPWRGGPGRVSLNFPLLLPRQALVLRCGIGIRDNTAKEPPSDGVTFKVVVLAPEPETLFARHTRRWEDCVVDLTPYAGREIVLRLVGDPGPRRDTTCDLGYFENLRLEPADARAAVRFTGTETFAVRGAEEWKVTVRQGPRGVWDSRFEIAGGGASLGFTGFVGRALLPDGRAVAPAWCTNDVTWTRDGEKLIARQTLVPGGVVECVIALIEDGFTVAFRGQGCELLEVGPGAFDAAAERVYAGVGNVLVRPEAFRLYADGHQLATRFAGFDFPGLAMVQATDTLPEYLEVVPERKIYRLAMGEDPVFTFVASTRGAFDAAIRYRNAVVSPLPASPGVTALKGRFVFDIWGGRYAQGAAFLRRAAAYGLTHAMVVWHDWQRWGYDYRLPAIFPPNPAHGSHEDFLELVDACRKEGILFAPHDNYIDIYPDYDGFTYDLVCLNDAGRPARAWYNKGRDAQSYRFRPDRFLPVLKDNLELVRDDIGPTAYFVDVFASIGPFSFYDAEGVRHRRRETTARWAEAFGLLRDSLQGAPQVSESGHDALVGALDGATCNHLRVDPEKRADMTWHVRCADSERIPWFDTVWREKFVLHGAGYANRFAGGLPVAAHGPQGDDYQSIEALDGHPSLVEAPFGRGVVRKYYLWHDFADMLGLCPVQEVEFVGGDIHVQRVTYRNGAVVCVNRSARDQVLEGAVVPPSGFIAKAEKYQAAVARRGAATAEWSVSPESWYVNPRTQSDRGRKAVRPVLREVVPSGDESLAFAIGWESAARLDTKNLSVFVHFLPEDEDSIVFQGDHAPPPELGGGDVVSRGTARVPREALPAQGEITFRVVAGLSVQSSGRRVAIDGVDFGEDRVLLGTVTLRYTDTLQVVAVAPVKAEGRANPAGAEVDFGCMRSTGAFRLTHEGRKWVLTPLPDSDAFVVVFPFESFPDLRELKVSRAFALTREKIEGVVAEQLPDAFKVTVPAGVYKCELTAGDAGGSGR